MSTTDPELLKIRNDPSDTRCWICGNTKHAIQYTAHFLRHNFYSASTRGERPAVALVCPICDSPGADTIPTTP